MMNLELTSSVRRKFIYPKVCIVLANFDRLKYLVIILMFFFGGQKAQAQNIDYKKIHDSLPNISFCDSATLQKITTKLHNLDTSTFKKSIHIYYQDLGQSFYYLFKKTKDSTIIKLAIESFDKSLYHKPNNAKVLIDISMCHFLLTDCKLGNYYLDTYKKMTPIKNWNISQFHNIPNICYPKINTLFVELLGNALLYSINYERLIKFKSKNKVAVRIGFHYSNNFNNNDQRITSIPIEFYYLHPISAKNHYLELGIGMEYAHDYFMDLNHVDQYFFATSRIGYRYQRRDGGFFLKVGFTPLYELYVINRDPANIEYPKIRPWAGLGIGYTFK